MAKIYSIARQGDYILSIEMEDWKDERRFIEYMFILDGPASYYTIHLTHLSGNLPDAMSNHTGMMFSTKDKDNDNLDGSSCARSYSGSDTKIYGFEIMSVTGSYFFFKLHNVEHYSNSIFHFQVVGGLTHVVAPI